MSGVAQAFVRVLLTVGALAGAVGAACWLVDATVGWWRR